MSCLLEQSDLYLCAPTSCIGTTSCLVVFRQGCSFGYHAGGWGKPPVDEEGKPLYGDVFGTAASTIAVSGGLSGFHRELYRLLFVLFIYLLCSVSREGHTHYSLVLLWSYLQRLMYPVYL